MVKIMADSTDCIISGIVIQIHSHLVIPSTRRNFLASIALSPHQGSQGPLQNNLPCRGPPLPPQGRCIINMVINFEFCWFSQLTCSRKYYKLYNTYLLGQPCALNCLHTAFSANLKLKLISKEERLAYHCPRFSPWKSTLRSKVQGFISLHQKQSLSFAKIYLKRLFLEPRKQALLLRIRRHFTVQSPG